MVIGVFMAMLVTGFLYYIVGVGNTIIFRERMQDAADAVAFSGAVMHARGMNLVALINIVLAILTAIWMAMKIVQYAIYAAIIVCGLGACIPLVPALEAADRFVDSAINAYTQAVLQPALSLGHSAEAAIRELYPQLAAGRALVQTLSGDFRPPVSGGTLMPLPARALPIHPVSVQRICDHAASMLTHFIGQVLSFFPPLRAILESRAATYLVSRICPQDRQDWRPYEIDPGSGDCSDGMPGQDCEYVQIRAVVFAGDTPFQGNERAVSVAAWGQSVGGGVFSGLQPLARIGVAQAEYYYEGDEDRDEWAWHMYWRARFRRVVVPSGIAGGVGVDFGLINRVIVH